MLIISVTCAWLYCEGILAILMILSVPENCASKWPLSMFLMLPRSTYAQYGRVFAFLYISEEVYITFVYKLYICLRLKGYMLTK